VFEAQSDNFQNLILVTKRGESRDRE
jgi:hypothetical protein